MGTHRALACAARVVIVLLLVAALHAGCQMGAVPAVKLAQQRQLVDDAGLSEPMQVEDVKATASVPLGWVELKTRKTLLYTHQQWRSPTRRTAMGIMYARLPLPLSPDVVAWMVRGEVKKRSKDGKLIREWTDDLGRRWFEVEDKDYHTTGYLMVRGFDLWINYWGYRVKEPREEKENKLAIQALKTVIPTAVQSAGVVVVAK